ncbi:MAG TPA: hypothetical protein VGB82_21455 [Alphaproteobacteria bacterium]
MAAFPRPGRAAALALLTLSALGISACDDLPMVKAVHAECANTAEPDRKACEDAAYSRYYAIERQKLTLQRVTN